MHAVRVQLAFLLVALLSLNAVLSTPSLQATGETTRGLCLLLSYSTAALVGARAVSPDFRSGMVCLWLQKPVDEARHFVARYLEAAAAIVVLVLAYVVAFVLAGIPQGTVSTLAESMFVPRLLVGSLVALAVATSVSTWEPRGGAVIPMIAVFAGVILDPTVAERQVEAGQWEWMFSARLLLFPESSFGVLFAGAPYRDGGVAALLALLRVSCFTLGSLTLGAIGTRHRAKKANSLRSA